MRRKLLIIFALLALALVACGADPSSAPQDPQSPEETPAAVQETGDKPQLIEFYADW